VLTSTQDIVSLDAGNLPAATGGQRYDNFRSAEDHLPARSAAS
jgi:hypothetical protein